MTTLRVLLTAALLAFAGCSADTPPPEAAPANEPAATATPAGHRDGTWAAQPLVVTDFGALGYWDGTAWVSAEAVETLPVAGGETYQVVPRDGGDAPLRTGGTAAIVCEPAETRGVLFEPPLTPVGELDAVAISAPWAMHPRPVERLPGGAAYVGFTADLLAERGLNLSAPRLTGVYRADLENDGTDEVIVTAGSAPSADGPAYGIAYVRRLVNDTVRTDVLGVSMPTPGAQGPPLFTFAVAAIADLSGDGTMEIALSERFYEGDALYLFDVDTPATGYTRRISTGCGA